MAFHVIDRESIGEFSTLNGIKINGVVVEKSGFENGSVHGLHAVRAVMGQL